MSDSGERIRAARFEPLAEPLNVQHIDTSTPPKELVDPSDDRGPHHSLARQLDSMRVERDSGIPSNTRELPDNFPVTTDPMDPLHWLTIQIKEEREKNSLLAHENAEMRKKLTTLEYSLAQWKLNAQETTDHLRRVVANREKPNYVDAFYDAKTKRLLQALAEENIFLKSELGNDDGLVRNIGGLSELRNRNQRLTEQLEIRTAENHELREQIRVFSTSDPNLKSLKDKVVELNSSMLQLTVENSTLRNQTNKQMETLTYLKSHFSKLRSEFLHIFGEHVSSENGEDFLKQLKSMDGEAAPAFLLKPLVKRSVSENATDPSVVEPRLESVNEHPAPVKRMQRDQDSGFDSLNDEQRELVSKSRELEVTKTEIARLTTENSRLRTEATEHSEEVRKMKQFVVTANEQAAKCRTETSQLREDNDRLRKERAEARNEALSWHAALQALTNEGNKQPPPPQEHKLQPSPSQQQHGSQQLQHLQQFDLPRQTIVSVSEPFQTSPFTQVHYRPEAILARDGGLRHPSKTSHPTESQETTDTSHHPRAGGAGPFAHSISEPAGPPISGPPPLPPRKGGSLDRNVPVRYHCQKCKQTIAAKEINEHKKYCDGYLDLRT